MALLDRLYLMEWTAPLFVDARSQSGPMILSYFSVTVVKLI